MAGSDAETGSNAAGRGVDDARIRAAVSELLLAIGEDPSRAGLRDTPARVAEAYGEFFSGIGVDPRIHLRETAALTDAGNRPGELILLRDIDFRSVCEHHLLPFVGVAHLAYLPRDRVVGLGKLPRVVETLASRPQLQERLTEQIADAIETGLDALGVLVVLDAVHGCVTARGARQARSSTVTVATRGALANPAERAEAMALIGKG
ncbi:MAG TPA: GTP cyclohydrolase I FolE [Terrimesophilobacter sp.]|uniref:GTP cyclohydrolase I FolE n=1 Tax=Terrimesophilobacter sp. TaxID=2906435 RepID=UPI002F924B6C